MLQSDGKQLLRFVEPVFRGRYNTISAAYTILALGAYRQIQQDQAKQEAVRFSIVDGGGQEHALTSQTHPLPRAAFTTEALKVRLAADTPLFFLLSQAGFDHEPPTAVVRDGLEITRDFLDPDGHPLPQPQQGQQVMVRLRVRALGAPVDNVAVIDLLPGGFEVLRESVPRDAGAWQADYVDVREDRVVFYGSFDTSPRELSYRAKATSAGEFTVPPPWAEAMYDRAVRAVGAAGRISVTPAP